METTNSPGITLRHIVLVKAQVAMADPSGKSEYHLCLTSLNRNESEDGKSLAIGTAFDVMHGIEKPLFKFNCEFIALYQQNDEKALPWKDFSSAMALAHIIPYLREFVSNITHRLPAPVLMLNPINVYSMITDYEQRLASSQQKKAQGDNLGG